MKTLDLSALPVLTLVGWQNSGPDHWQTLWEQQYAWKRVQQKDWMHPKKADWVGNTVQAIRAKADTPILVTHSLGGPTLAHTIATHPDLNIRAAFIVATPDLEREDTPEEIKDFSPTPLSRLPFPSVVVASSTDPYSTLERAQYFAEQWGSRLINVGDREHIGDSAQLGNWDEGKRLLSEFLSTL